MLLPQFVFLENKMNNYDKENLQFLLNADEKTLSDWYSTVNEDDHTYASELLSAYGLELDLAKTLLSDNEIINFHDAKILLSNFTISNKQ